MNIDALKRLLAECGSDTNFETLLESVLTENAARLSDLESNSKYHKDEKGVDTHKDIELQASDFVYTVAPGSSISKSGNLFIPMPFAMNAEDGKHIVRYINNLLQTNQSVKLSVVPGYGIDSENVYPASVIHVLPHEEKALIADQLGNGFIIVGVNGDKLSSIISKPLPANYSTENELGSKDSGKPRDEWHVPEWLDSLRKMIDEMVATGKLKVEKARMHGFTGELIFSTPTGDAVLITDTVMSKAAYVVKKKVLVPQSVEGESAKVALDYDVYINELMEKFIAKYRRKAAGTKKDTFNKPNLETKRHPRLSLRDELIKHDNGFALRRDFNLDVIKQMFDNGINYDHAKAAAADYLQSLEVNKPEIDNK